MAVFKEIGLELIESVGLSHAWVDVVSKVIDSNPTFSKKIFSGFFRYV